MYPIMGGKNVDLWHDRMYAHYTLIPIYLLLKWHVYNNFKVIATCNFNAISEKIKYGWLHMYVRCV
jgi:hypothetical protein